MSRETKAQSDKMTCIERSKPRLPAREQYCQNPSKYNKLLWEELLISYPGVLLSDVFTTATSSATSIWDFSVSGKTPGA